MIVWNYRVSYENNLQGTDEIEQILRTIAQYFRFIVTFMFGLTPILVYQEN